MAERVQETVVLLRYGASRGGSLEKKAHVYLRDEHGIDAQDIDPDAVHVCRVLRRAGFHAYVVGGAIRDLLVGRRPKDFDIATDARPRDVKRLFRSARLIGRRFRIVHVYFGRQKYLEITTFRSEGRDGSQNWFGTMEEDARRRDFTINALYYEPFEQQVVDYVGGLDDVRARRLRTLAPAESSFPEDPVRMIRALKYAAYTGFPLPLAMRLLVRRLRGTLRDCSRERVTEEVFKILISGKALEVFTRAFRLGLLEVLLPAVDREVRATARRFSDSSFAAGLSELDARTATGHPLEREEMFSFLLRDLALKQRGELAGADLELAVHRFLRAAAEPLFPSRRDLLRATRDVLARLGEAWRPHRRRRRRRGGRLARRRTPGPPPGGGAS